MIFHISEFFSYLAEDDLVDKEDAQWVEDTWNKFKRSIFWIEHSTGITQTSNEAEM